MMEPTMRILLIDDNKDGRESLSKLIELDGNTVNTGSNFEDLQNKLDENVDAIILDYLMPGKDGVEIVKEIRSNRVWDRIPIILLTGYSGVEIPTGHLGSFCLLLKPVSLSQIYTAIDTSRSRPRP